MLEKLSRKQIVTSAVAGAAVLGFVGVLTGAFQKEALPSEAQLREKAANVEGAAFIDTLGPNTFWRFNIAGHPDADVQALYQSADKVLINAGFQRCSDVKPYEDLDVGYLQEGEGKQLSIILHKNTDDPKRVIYADDCGAYPGLEAHLTTS